MADQKLQKVQESAKPAATRQVGSGDAPTQIPTHARHIGPWRHEVGISGGWIAGPPKEEALVGRLPGAFERSDVLPLSLFRAFSDAAGKWKCEIFEKGPDGDVLLATFEGTTQYRGYDLKVTKWKAENASVPEGQRCLLPVAFGRVFHAPDQFDRVDAIQGGLVYYVPLKGHQDYANESWVLYVKVHVDDGLVHDDDADTVHVWLDWPKGSIVYPMLGAPALVSSADHWLEILVALDRPLPPGAEKFALKSMLRLFPWGKKAARQAALKKRTFKLTDDDAKFDFRRHSFADVGSDAKDASGKAEKDDVFKLRLGMMEHYALAEREFTAPAQHTPIISRSVVVMPDPVDPADRHPGVTYATVDRGGAEVPLPVLTNGRDIKGNPIKAAAPKASALHLYKLRAKIDDKGKGLYDLIWMTGEDFSAANTVVTTGSNEVIRPLQDQRLRDTLHVMSVKSHVDEAVNARVSFKLNGKAKKGDDWEPTKNELDTKEKSFETIQSRHPVYVHDPGPFKLGHLTDLHLDVRLDIMAQNPLQLIPEAAGAAIATPPVGDLINNYNATFTELALTVLDKADALVLTGDLIDYNRGFSLGTKGDVDQYLCWKLGLSSNAKASQYKRERNWVHFYQIILRLYDKRQKPIFTTLGNHDYRPNPYSAYPGISSPWATFSVYPTIGGDLNLTLAELAASYGPQYASVTPSGSQIRADAASIDNYAWSVHWYHHAINAWKDYAVTAGDVGLLMMDWDVEESCIDIGKGSSLPRAKLFMTKTQERIYERWRNSAPACKLMACHPTLVCNSLAINITNAMVREKELPIDDLNHGTMGERTLRGSDHVWVSAIREKISHDIATGKVSTIVTGHSHMDGIYKPSADGKKARMIYPKKPASDGKMGLTWEFPAGSVAGTIIVTNCGGPMGEFTDVQWTRRSRPSGSVFTLSGSSVTMEHIESKRPETRVRRCVVDCERVRVSNGFFFTNAPSIDITSGAYKTAAGVYEGSFFYLEDPEGLAPNTVPALALVSYSKANGWRSDISPLTPGEHRKGKDPNGKGQVGLVELRYAFPKQLLGSVLASQEEEAYMVLLYGGEARDNWVIPVAPQVPKVDDVPDITSESEAKVAHQYIDRLPCMLVDVKFPRFGAQYERWSTKTK